MCLVCVGWRRRRRKKHHSSSSGMPVSKKEHRGDRGDSPRRGAGRPGCQAGQVGQVGQVGLMFGVWNWLARRGRLLFKDGRLQSRPRPRRPAGPFSGALRSHGPADQEARSEKKKREGGRRTERRKGRIEMDAVGWPQPIQGVHATLACVPVHVPVFVVVFVFCVRLCGFVWLGVLVPVCCNWTQPTVSNQPPAASLGCGIDARQGMWGGGGKGPRGARPGATARHKVTRWIRNLRQATTRKTTGLLWVLTTAGLARVLKAERRRQTRPRPTATGERA